jgi:LytS/YehU family sensor histidine kinase
VRHGIDPHEAGGRIDVKAWRDERGAVRVAVTDDGAGFSPNAPTGTGLANLRERLKRSTMARRGSTSPRCSPHGLCMPRSSIVGPQ